MCTFDYYSLIYATLFNANNFTIIGNRSLLASYAPSPTPGTRPGLTSMETLGCGCLWEKSWTPALGLPKGGTSSLSREGALMPWAQTRVGASEGHSLLGDRAGGLVCYDEQRPPFTRSGQLARGDPMSRTDPP